MPLKGSTLACGVVDLGYHPRTREQTELFRAPVSPHPLSSSLGDGQAQHPDHHMVGGRQRLHKACLQLVTGHRKKA